MNIIENIEIKTGFHSVIKKFTSSTKLCFKNQKHDYYYLFNKNLQLIFVSLVSPYIRENVTYITINSNIRKASRLTD